MERAGTIQAADPQSAFPPGDARNGLTGLGNRAVLDRRVSHQIAGRHSVILIDLDQSSPILLFEDEPATAALISRLPSDG